MAAPWIGKAIKHPGALTKKAKSAGQGTQAFAQAHKGDRGTTGKQARLAITLSHLHNRSTGGSPPFTEQELRQGHRKLPVRGTASTYDDSGP